ncbi:cytoplasmic dynein heavy chain [Cavenderia fasciculata]|uniref:Cytoplasmic dynein heavy chain n=1 Tax=Cavenderia fasciculata TaxID=261658 RepID=F4PZ52_CACFS|nr:cytoplasmic dynein heavy chain [Cavenderia fasciculata]EGG19081.1 cytoplasmic dynein heavy chain [Cavenderia fasciculata]|eukprot:XP_004366714.1 cytoplasmic dynein heavy chain [Cavenderia fasciculata]
MIYEVINHCLINLYILYIYYLEYFTFEINIKPVSSQLQVINLGEGAPFDTLHNFIHNSVAPFIRSFALKSQTQKNTNTVEKDVKLGIGAVNQKIAELELSLYNCREEQQTDKTGSTTSSSRLQYASRVRQNKAASGDKSASEDKQDGTSDSVVISIIKPRLETSIHEVIRNQVLSLDPSLEFARVSWIQQLHQWLNITFRDMLAKLPRETLDKAYATIQSKLDEVHRYVQIWLQYQALWDMESSYVYNKLGDDLSRWQNLLGQIKKSRTTFDNSDTDKAFGPLIIDYAQVQASVNNKYDFWHKDILSHFGQKLAEKMRAFYDTIAASRTELEKLSVESVSTEEAVSFIIQIQEMKRRLIGWEADLKYYRSGQDLLQRQRFQFPNDWLDCDMVEAEWSAFNDILNRKNASKSKSISDRIREFAEDWSNNKPLAGSIKHAQALDTIRVFESRMIRLRDENTRLQKAKQALDQVDQTGGSSDEERLQPVEEEMQDLKAVWSELAVTWLEIDTLRETAWSAVVPRKVIEKESKAMSPLLLCSVPGYDASSVVDDLAAELRKPYKSWAIGSPEGFQSAEKSIYDASKSGSWVLLKVGVWSERVQLLFQFNQPLWSQMDVFEYNDADLRGAIDSIDYWIDLYSKGRSNIDPDKIPWVAVRTILGQTIYGGRVDNEFDMRLLNSFLEQLFTPAAFNADFPLIQSIGLTVPDGTNRANFVQWIDNLPDAKKVVNDLQKMQLSEEDAIEPSSSSESGKEQQEDKSKLKLKNLINDWIKTIPKPMKQPKRTAQNIKDPLFRCFEREITIVTKLIKKITTDLNSINELLAGTIKQTNYLRSLTGSITKVWLAGLLNPEPYITATRQSSAQLNGWSLGLTLDSMSMVSVKQRPAMVSLSRVFHSKVPPGTTRSSPQQRISPPIATTTLSWRDKDDPIFASPATKLTVPVYLNDTRTELLFSLDLQFLQTTTKQSWYQRSVSISSWKPDF